MHKKVPFTLAAYSQMFHIYLSIHPSMQVGQLTTQSHFAVTTWTLSLEWEFMEFCSQSTGDFVASSTVSFCLCAQVLGLYLVQREESPFWSTNTTSSSTVLSPTFHRRS
uniref:Uncharacterized protein n=2 Tax=Anguilla anguilla TaxID=7936 RepID=A0A0E9UBS2_ANGAN